MPDCPLTTEARVKYTEVKPMQRLAYVHVVDLLPEVEAYDVATVIEFHAERNRVRMVIYLDAMHSEPMDEAVRRRLGKANSQRWTSCFAE